MNMNVEVMVEGNLLVTNNNYNFIMIIKHPIYMKLIPISRSY